MESLLHISWLIPLMPLLGAAVAGFFGAKWLKGNSHWPIWIGVGIAAVISLALLFATIGASAEHAPGEGRTEAIAAQGDAEHVLVGKSYSLFTWFQAGTPGTEGTPNFFGVTAGFWIDPLSVVMLSVVCGIGFFITVFAAGYMKGEEGYFRFFAYLGLFIFMMTLLVMGENLIMLYLGWEGVGLCSYLLIGYYYEKPSAREAAKKAFLVNRVGDFGFGLGIMLCFLAFGTVSYFGSGIGGADGLLELAAASNLSNFQKHALEWIPFLLMMGAFGKSAQFPLHVWLPDAMEGPTPVSALIHAATMVTAGVYMIARCGTLFVGNHAAMITIAVIGGFTAIFAATIALRQFDLKKVFAYSTVSQLGFMFVGVGMLAPVAGVFHLVTHAFFKALLFLSSGVVMHAMGGILDMREMSGIKNKLPWTNKLMLVGCLALAGFPLMSGFFSKDEIIAAAFGHGDHKATFNLVLGLVMLFTAFLTAYYTFRLYFRVFQGPEIIPPATMGHGHGHAVHDADEAVHAGGHAPAHGSHAHHDHHDHEPRVMIIPLMVLAVGAIIAGFLNFPAHALGEFLGKSPSFQLSYQVAAASGAHVDPAHFGQHSDAPHGFPWVMVISALVAVSGIGLAYLLHLKQRAAADRMVEKFRPVTVILEAKYWMDEIYQGLIVEPLRMLGKIYFAIDRFLIDGIVSTVSWVPQLSGWALKLTVQRGSLQGYASAMLFGLMVILLIIFV
jgi:NADH-quinone oxidoreductase subunit L